MQWPNSLPANVSSKGPMSLLSSLALSTCLHLFLLNTPEARMIQSNSSSSYYSPPLPISVSKHLHTELIIQKAPLNSQGHIKALSNQPAARPGEPFTRSKIQEVQKEGTGDNSSMGSNMNDHMQNRSGRQIRLMMGRLGSAPPSCVMRCAGCVPCNPVHVPIQRGRKRIGLLEYYPEAWRCKCKNKLYMPASTLLP